MKNTRTSKILINEIWQEINPIDIKVGMKFKLFEEDGSQVIGNDNSMSWIATSDAFYNEDGVITIMTLDE